jgi:curli biogenesis system outer membrane secretion channel CsgG
MKRRTVALALGALVVICICLAIATSGAKSPAAPTSTPAPVSTKSPVPPATNTPRPTPTIAWRLTLSMYNQVADGISYAEAVKIIGKEGTEQSRNTLAGYVTVMYMWQNSDGSNMNAMFQNDKLIQRAQFGLK